MADVAFFLMSDFFVQVFFVSLVVVLKPMKQYQVVLHGHVSKNGL